MGRAGGSYSGAGPDPTASDEQSKVWFHDGSWWSVMWSEVADDFHVFRLDPPGLEWVDTGVMVDERNRTRSDVLWDGTHLYVASHKFSLRSGIDSPTRLYRLSYRRDLRTYSLDVGFPVVVNRYRPQTVVLDKDSTGQLWATWTQNGRVVVSRTVCEPTCDDRRWGTPFVLPVMGERIGLRDVASVVAFGGDSIGLMWSNQVTRTFSFAVHSDRAPDRTWRPRVPIVGISADDHISLKGDRTGRVVAMVKTSAVQAGDPLNVLLVRDPRTGEWKQSVFGFRRDRHTRAIVVIDQPNDAARVFATGPAPGATTRGGRSAIYEKSALLSDPSFPSGVGTLVMATQGSVGNPTSAKHPVTKQTGLLVLAGEVIARRYWYRRERRLVPPVGATGLLPTTPTTDTTAIEAPAAAGDTATGGAVLALLAATGLAAVVLATALGTVALRRRRRQSYYATPKRVHTPTMRREPQQTPTESLPRARRGYDVEATDRLVNKISAKYEAARAAEAQMRSEVDRLQAELERARAAEQPPELRAEVERLQTALEGERLAAVEREELRLELERVRAELESARASAAARDDLQTELGRLQEELEAQRIAASERDGLRRDVERLEAELEGQRGVAGELEGLRAEVERLRGELEGTRDLTSEREGLHAEMEGLRAELEVERGAAGERDGLRAEVEGLRAELEAERGAAGEHDGLRAEVERLQAELEAERGAAGERDGLRADVERLESELAAARAGEEVEGESADALRARRRELEQERDGLESEVDVLRAYRRELERDRDRLESELEALREHYRDLEQDRERRESEIEQLRTGALELRREHEVVAGRIEQLAGERAELEQEQERLAAQVEHLRAMTEEASERLTEVLNVALEGVKLGAVRAGSQDAGPTEPVEHADTT